MALLAPILLPCLAQADPVPTIQTYEVQKQRVAKSEARHNPKAFWMRQIVEGIERHRPTLAGTLRAPLTVTVGFVVARDGSVRSKSIETSSGIAVADKLALEMIDRAAPFPPIPDALSEEQFAFALPIRFR